MRLTRRRITAVIALAALLGLTACDGDPGEPGTTDETSTQDETTSEEPTTEDPTTEESTEPPVDIDEPEVPPEMLVDDHTGAAAAAWYYFELYDYARATGDTSAFERMSGDDCNWCATASTSVSEVYESGGRIDGADLVFDISAATVEPPAEARPYYAVRIDEATDASFIVVDSDRQATEQPEQVLSPLVVGVDFTGDRFVVVGVDYERT